MRILYHSAAPWVSGGYGRVTQEVVTRLQNETDHEIGIQCLTSVKKDPIMWHGEVWDGEQFVTPRPIDEPIPVYPSSSSNASTHFGMREVMQHYESFNADFYFTHWDTWMDVGRDNIPNMDIPYGSYVIVDHYPCPAAVVEQVTNAFETVSMSRFAQQALMEKGIRSRQIPHGVDTEEYEPLSVDERATKMKTEIDGKEAEVDLTERFVIGMVAANYADRKNIPHHMQAFKRFIEEVDEDALMYMHMWQKNQAGFNLYQVQQELGIPDENIVWIPPDLYHDVGDIVLNNWYNNMDVLVNCSMGESWGLTITEAMACGTPAIVTNTTAMPEQIGVSPKDSTMDNEPFVEGVGGLAVEPRIGIWREKVSSKQFICSPEDIFRAMKFYYMNPDKKKEHGKGARERVVNNYSWDEHVIPEFIDMFDRLGEILG